MGEDSSTKRKKEGNFYETPKWAVEALIKRESFEGIILEPCSGKGAISKVLESYGYEVVSSDKSKDKSIYGENGKDALSLCSIYDNIVTNPPYDRNELNELIQKFQLIYKRKLALLLRLSFLESEGRREFFSSFPLKVVYVFSSRVTMHPENEESPQNSGTVAYAWFVWEKGFLGKTTIQWISDKEAK